MRFNFSAIGQILGFLLLMNGFFMGTCIPVAYYLHNETDLIALFYSSSISAFLGGFTWLIAKKKQTDKEMHTRDGYIIVTFGWLIMSASGSLPYLFSGAIPAFTDAFFETISGYSTTGASVLNNIESLPKDILLWRSMTQWLGGMGIIVLAVAILPLLGIGGMQLFVAEAPGISPDKLQPRIAETAKRLWLIYIGLTGLETILLMIGGMSLYDAINHSFTTMSSGGFSTKQDSAVNFSPFIQYVIIFFMILAGSNFTLTYFALKGRFKKVLEDEELRYYLASILIFTLAIGGTIYFIKDLGAEKSFRDALFQVVSIITTTGYVSADYTAWNHFALTCIFILMFFGASAGSTAGGIKVVRHIILLKNSFLEFRRQIHPRAIIPVRLNRKAVSQDIVFNVIAFVMIYIMIFAVSSIILSFVGVDLITSMGAVATCLGNVGPGLGKVGPMDNFAGIPAVGKWLLSILMLMGRLELFTVLMLFSPYYWTKN